jgi:hypothetical protein
MQGHTGKPAGRVIDVGRGRQGYGRVHKAHGNAAIASRARALTGSSKEILWDDSPLKAGVSNETAALYRSPPRLASIDRIAAATPASSVD